ncbi:hypothetical protein K461DRAFT_171807 [Myriangium duriaei CBS 260.36]|uniref:C2H2-type domain-containing protein n=1 Tax=Myriangium duriaei CBS 260.36 TaxID=1168546 RepID=A0A9P4IZ51_9PEZI|nr:hypothetical protein K461DRAFT_171807 [Myriangium duriaei CBS 260.36]
MSNFPPQHDPTSPFCMDWNPFIGGAQAPSISSGYEMHLDQAALGPEFDDSNVPTDDLGFSFNDDFPLPLPDVDAALDDMGGDFAYMSPASPFSTGPFSYGQDPGQNVSLSIDDILPGNANTHVNASPWNASMPRSDPTARAGSFQFAGQPRHEFMQSLPSSFPGVSWIDSGYVSQPPTDTASLISAPSALMVPASDASDCQETMERPAKKARKTVFCNVPGPHRTREFNNIHDLERHQRSTHGMVSHHSQGNYFRCVVENCRNPTKIWDRKDNFRSHLVRRHFAGKNDDENREELDNLVQQSRTNMSQEDIVMNHMKKEAAKRTSRQTAKRRLARKISRMGSDGFPAANDR